MNIFFLLVSSAFSARQEHIKIDEIQRIEFTSVTRGSQERLVLSSDSIIFIYTGADRQEKRQAKANYRQEWKRIVSTINDFDWNNFDALPSPTNKRAYDGAKHSSIIITTRSNGTHNHTFDDENPNEKLAKLMTCIKEHRSELHTSR